MAKLTFRIIGTVEFDTDTQKLKLLQFFATDGVPKVKKVYDYKAKKSSEEYI